MSPSRGLGSSGVVERSGEGAGVHGCPKKWTPWLERKGECRLCLVALRIGDDGLLIEPRRDITTGAAGGIGEIEQVALGCCLAGVLVNW
ncbi:hypothetical protein M0R45_020548 [Rubus argutus]|uniref:Uncharacterized protein n=1 Tax=Rubus argutus TaxID=59490 RepID=A0AAW1XAC5_RUBAR